MKITAYLNPDAQCRLSANIRMLMTHHGLKYDEHDSADFGVEPTNSSDSQKLQNQVRVQVGDDVLIEPTTQALGSFLLEKGIIDLMGKNLKSSDSNPTVTMDEENEALRTKTTRFF